MMAYFLIIEVCSLPSLDRAMGRDVADAALAVLGPRLAGIVAPALAQFPGAGPLRKLHRGRWASNISVEPEMLTGGADDPVRSLTATLHHLVKDVSIETFGPRLGAFASAVWGFSDFPTIRQICAPHQMRGSL